MAESTFLAGGGVAGELLRSIDWSTTPLGAIDSWPTSLKCAVGTVLHARHPMFLWWGEDLIQFYNDAYLPSLGVGKHPAAMGQRGKECWGEIWPIIGPQIDDVMTRGKASWHEDALVPILRNGGLEDVYWTYGYSPVYDDEGRIGGVLVVCTETTTRVVAENALRRSEALFRAVVEKSTEVVSLTSAEGTTRYLTPNAWQLLGWTPEEAGTRTLREQIIPEDQARIAYELERLTRPGDRDLFLVFRVRHRDGSLRWIEATGTNLLADPDVAAIVTNYRDITSRKRAEEALRASELRYRQLIEDLPEPVLVHVDGKIAFANAASAEALGAASPDELLGRSIVEFAAPGTGAQLEERLESARQGGDPPEVAEQTVVRLDDGREVHAEVKTVRITYEGQSAMLSIARDITGRVEAERATVRALQEADLGRRKLEAVLAALPVGVWLADEVGRLLQTNPAAARIWGGKAPLLDKPSEYAVYQAFWPATGKALAGEEWALARTLQTGETILAEAVDIQRFDGTRGHVLSSTAPILDEHGRMVGGVVVLLDVTEVHEAARERERLVTSLEFERRRLGRLLQDAPAFIAVLRGKDHVFELVNDAYRTLVGGREVIGRTVVDALPELRGQGFEELLDQVLTTGERVIANEMPVFLTQRVGAEPEQRYVSFVYQPLVEVDGTRSGVFVHGFDVTDATLTQQRVRAQFHGIPVPTYIWQRVERDGGRQFVLVDVNQAALTASQGEIAKHLGESAMTYFADAPTLREEIERCLDEGATIQREMDGTLTSTGETRRLFVTYAAAPPDLVIVHMEDVTARVKLEGQLRQAQKMDAVGRLAGGVAHDFNNMLSVILGNAQFVLPTLAPDDPRRDDIEEILEAAERSAKLTKQLLAFASQQPIEPKMIDINDAIDQLLKLLRRLIGEDIELTWKPGSRLGPVLMDGAQLDQILANLAVNAREAIAGVGRLVIETDNASFDQTHCDTNAAHLPGDFVQITVSDSGCGMDKATMAKVFEPFFTTRQVGKGTGLGLAMVYGIVQQNGGFINVYSEVGIGTTFRIYLPQGAQPQALAAKAPAVGALPRGSETILIVEDEEALIRLTRRLLEGLGYVVIATANPPDAVTLAESAKIDLLLTDVIMPLMSGREVYESLRATRPELKCLYVSGYTAEVITRRGVLEAGAHFLAKPFTRESLARKVRDVLDR